MILANQQGKLIGTVVPSPGVQSDTSNQLDLEERITLSFNVLADIPLDDLQLIGRSNTPLNALADWIDQKKRTH